MEKNEYKQMYEVENTYWWYRILHELVESVVKKTGNRNLTILDVGCGTGRMMELLQSYGHVDGFDYSQEALNFSRKRGITRIQLLDLNIWEPQEATYDVIVCLDVLCSQGIHDDYGTMRRMYHALRPHGLLIMNMPAFKMLKRHHDVRVFVQKRYDKKEMKEKLEAMGFSMAMMTYRLPMLFIIILFKKIVERFQPFDPLDSDLKPLPRWLNRLFLFLGRLENRVICQGVTMPFGSSVFVVAEKQ